MLDRKSIMNDSTGLVSEQRFRVEVVATSKWSINEQQLTAAVVALTRAIATNPAVRSDVIEIVRDTSNNSAAAERGLRGAIKMTSFDAIRYFRRNVATKVRSAIRDLIHESVLFAQLNSQHAPNKQTFQKLVVKKVTRSELQRLNETRFSPSGRLGLGSALALLWVFEEGEKIFKRFSELRRNWATEDDAVVLLKNEEIVKQLPRRRRRIVSKIIARVPHLRAQDKAPKNLAKLYAVMVLEPDADTNDVSLKSAQRRFTNAKARVRQSTAQSVAIPEKLPG
jgi:hypothetical protein